MPTHIRFRLNKLTGEVEEFLVDDQDHSLPEAEHDRIAAEVARVITRHPLLHEVTARPPSASGAQRQEDAKEEERDRTPDRHRQGGGES